MNIHNIRRPPRTIGLSMVKNEQDIIEPFVRHNAGLLDALIVIDNGSVDDTRAILIALARELGNVVVGDSSRFGYNQSQRITGLLQTAQSSFFADFVLFLDADEFIGATSCHGFHQQLALIPPNGFGAMAWQNFVLPNDDQTHDAPRALTERRAEEARLSVKTIIRLDGVFRSDLTVNMGSHSVTRAGAPMTGVFLSQLPLWHYPIRSSAQLTAKAVVGWMACLAANPKAAESRSSYHWSDMYRQITRGQGFGGSDLRKLSLHYADVSYSLGAPQPPEPPIITDPAPIVYSRAYSTGRPLDPLILVALSWEQAFCGDKPIVAPDAFPGLTLDIPPIRFVIEKHSPASILDVSCGLGLHIELCSRLGVADLVGVGIHPAHKLQTRSGGYVQQDETIRFTLGRSFDLVLFLDATVSPISDEAIILVENVVRHAEQMILFSLLDPSESALRAWLQLMRNFGFVPDLIDTLGLRCLASLAVNHRGIVLLRRQDAPGITNATDDLLAIASLPYQKHSAPAQIHNEVALLANTHWIGYVTEF